VTGGHYAPVPPSTEGIVVSDDNQELLHMKWDNGRNAGAHTGSQSFFG